MASTGSQSDELAVALEELRLAEARLERRRQAAAQPSIRERAATRFVFERADADDAARPSELAEHLGMSRSATTGLLKRLSEQGIVAVREHPSDGRGRVIVPLSRNDHMEGDDELTDQIRAATRRLDMSHVDVFVEFLEELRELIDRAVARIDRDGT